MQGIAKTAFLAMTALLVGGAVARGADQRAAAAAVGDRRRAAQHLHLPGRERRLQPVQPDGSGLHQRRPLRLAVAGDHRHARRVGGADHRADLPRRAAVGFGGPPLRPVVRPEPLYARRHLDQPADLQRPAVCRLALCELRPAVHLQAPRSEDRHRRAGAARHPAARSGRDRPGGGRRVRAEQLPQADRRRPGQWLGQPAPQRADNRPRLRAPLAHRPARW